MMRGYINELTAVALFVSVVMYAFEIRRLRRNPLLVQFYSYAREWGLELFQSGLVLFVALMVGDLMRIGLSLAEAFSFHILIPAFGGYYLLTFVRTLVPKYGLRSDGFLDGARTLPWSWLQSWQWRGNELVLQYRGLRYTYPFDAASRPRVEAAMRQIKPIEEVPA